MKCPICEANTSCLATRNKEGKQWRRRKCEDGHIFTTIEVLEVIQDENTKRNSSIINVAKARARLAEIRKQNES